MEKRSPLNTGRTLARNRRKQLRTKENREYRASLHAQKANANSQNADTIQRQIDQISKRG
jgi:hypothetical protein